MKRRSGGFRSNSIKSRIFLCFLCLLGFMTAMLFYYIISITQINRHQTLTSFRQLSTELHHQLEEKIDVVDKAAKSCGYYSMVQKSLFSPVPSEKQNSVKAAREMLNTYKDTYPYIKDIFLFVPPRTRIYSNTTYIKEYYGNSAYYGFDTDVTLSRPFLSAIVSNDENLPYFFYYVPISNIQNNGTRISAKNDALCTVLCDFSSLINMPKDQDNSTLIYALIYDGSIISCSTTVNPELSAVLLDSDLSAATVKYQGKAYYYYSDTMEHSLRFVCISSASSIRNDHKQVRQFLYLLAAIGSSITMLLLFITSNKFSHSISNILADLSGIQNQTGSSRVNVPQTDELKALALQINELLDRLELSTKEEQNARENLFLATMAQQEAEMLAYRNQINPHFLFNTMECMRSMAQYYRVEPLEEIVTSMAKLFRYSLYAPKHVPFSEEIEHAEQYLKIISYRYSQEYMLQKFVSDGAAAYTTPSMILQPLVENCVKHGFLKENINRSPRLVLQVYEDAEHCLNISLTDNGCGISAAELSRIEQELDSLKTETSEKKDSIGIHNIHKRLKLSNMQNSIHIYSKEGYYTQIKIRIMT